MLKLAHIFLILILPTNLFAGNQNLYFELPNAEKITLTAGDLSVGELHGVFSQGGVAFGNINGKLNIKTIKFNGEEVKFTKDKKDKNYRFILGFNIDEPKMAILEVQFDDETKFKKVFPIEKRKYEIQEINGLPEKKVNPPKEVWDRIERENNSVGRARKIYSKNSYYENRFISPVDGQVTGIYGTKRILNGQPKSPHYGIDIAAPAGTLIYAPAGGIVRLINEDMYYTGKTMVLDHGNGLSSTFMHMQKILVKDKQEVKQGDVIGKVGSTGRSTGSHLDWRMNVLKTRIDPAFFVPSLRKQP